MKKNLLIFSFIMLMILYTSSCKSFSWDPTGIWSLVCDYYTGGNTCTEVITLSGDEDSGTVTGINYCGWVPGQTGTFTKTADFTCTVHAAFPSSWGEYITINWTFTSSEAAPNTATGTGSSQEDTSNWPCNITATKVTNLQ